MNGLRRSQWRGGSPGANLPHFFLLGVTGIGGFLDAKAETLFSSDDRFSLQSVPQQHCALLSSLLLSSLPQNALGEDCEGT